VSRWPRLWISRHVTWCSFHSCLWNCFSQPPEHLKPTGSPSTSQLLCQVFWCCQYFTEKFILRVYAFSLKQEGSNQTSWCLLCQFIPEYTPLETDPLMKSFRYLPNSLHSVNTWPKKVFIYSVMVVWASSTWQTHCYKLETQPSGDDWGTEERVLLSDEKGICSSWN
jgi:hypothetical protein